jgi:hypothetical protein
LFTTFVDLILMCRQKGAEAAERARLVEEYQQRRQAAAMNKARGQAEMYGVSANKKIRIQISLHFDLSKS